MFYAIFSMNGKEPAKSLPYTRRDGAERYADWLRTALSSEGARTVRIVEETED